MRQDSIQHISLSEKINTDGFRQWHEYELARSFGYLGLGVLSLIAGLALMEGVFEIQRLAERGIKLLACFCLLCVTGWAWFRFINILLTAEDLSRQAVCDNCHRYGQITVLDERSNESLTQRIMTCQCNKCQHQWRLAYTLQSRDVHL